MSTREPPVRGRCDNRHCPDHRLLVIVPDPDHPRCPVCGWAVRPQPAPPLDEDGGDAA